MDNLCVLVLAGGLGTRFWPMSTSSKPKQFLNLIGNKTMLELTVDRVDVPKERIFIVTQETHKDLVKEQIKDINDKNIIIQLEVRNTAPCIMMATNYINQIYKDANILVLPSDHLITDENKFREDVKLANDYLSNNKESIITFGIMPTRPETGYGYINATNYKMDEVQKVNSFTEKPSLEKALSYLRSKEYLWNSGMFLFNANHIMDLFKEHLANTYEQITSLPSINSKEYDEELLEHYSKCDNISFDYAIMEKNESTYVIPCNIGWDDIGSWQSLERYCDKDNNSNITKGDVEYYDSKNNIVYGNNKRIVLLGIDDIFLIDSDDTIIIANKGQVDKIHSLKKVK